MNKVKVDTGGKLEMYTVDNFLTDEECDYVKNYIDSNNYKSGVTADNETGSTVSDYRTSHSSTLNYSDPRLKAIDEKIHNFMGIPTEQGEGCQGQRYEVGQYFNDHTDFFTGNEAKMHIGDQGQRNWTCMIYLNDVEEGGETDFPKIGKKFHPKKGRAVIWNSLYPDQKGNPDSLHAGRPVVKGTKYIVTKWFRNGIPFDQMNGSLDVKPSVNEPEVKRDEARFQSIEIVNPNVVEQIKKADPRLKESDYVAPFEMPPLVNGVRTFSKREHIPVFTQEGFKVIDLPDDLWNYMKDIYTLLKDKEQPEGNLGKFIYSDELDIPATMMNMDNLPHLKKELHKKIQPIMEEWSGYELELATFYGIRSYKRGAVLSQHLDRLSELHVSGIILVDENAEEPWALDIIDHYGKWHAVTIKPGQMILYESARLSHGRDKPFKGEFFNNCFVHYKIKDWVYGG